MTPAILALDDWPFIALVSTLAVVESQNFAQEASPAICCVPFPLLVSERDFNFSICFGVSLSLLSFAVVHTERNFGFHYPWKIPF